MCLGVVFFFSVYRDHRAPHLRSPSFPTRPSSDLQPIVFATPLPAEIKQLAHSLLTDPVTVLSNPPAPRLIITAQSARIRDTEARRRVRDLLPERSAGDRKSTRLNSSH